MKKSLGIAALCLLLITAALTGSLFFAARRTLKEPVALEHRYRRAGVSGAEITLLFLMPADDKRTIVDISFPEFHADGWMLKLAVEEQQNQISPFFNGTQEQASNDFYRLVPLTVFLLHPSGEIQEEDDAENFKDILPQEQTVTRASLTYSDGKTQETSLGSITFFPYTAPTHEFFGHTSDTQLQPRVICTGGELFYKNNFSMSSREGFLQTGNRKVTVEGIAPETLSQEVLPCYEITCGDAPLESVFNENVNFLITATYTLEKKAAHPLAVYCVDTLLDLRNDKDETAALLIELSAKPSNFSDWDIYRLLRERGDIS